MAVRLKANRRFPSVPHITSDLDNHTLALQAIKESLEIGERRTSDILNSFIRVQDLIDIGLIDFEGNTEAIVGADLSTVASIGDLTGAATGDFLRFDGTEWSNDTLHLTDITQAMVTQHQAALAIAWSQLTGQPALIADVAGLSDPGADRLLFWDDSAGELTWLQLGTGLSITGTTLNASGGGGGGASYLDDLLDVDAPYPSVGDVLTFDGVSWVAAAPGESTLPAVILAAAPMAYWRLNEASGTLTDSSGNGYDLTVTGSGNTYRRAAIVPNEDEAYFRIGAGTDNYASRTGTLGFSTPLTSSYTVELVVRLEEVSGGQNYRLFVMSAAGETEATNYQMYLGFSPAGAPLFFWEYGGSGTNFDFQSNKVAIPKGVPVHVAWQKDSTDRVLKIFINGALADQTTYTSGQEITGGSSVETSIGDKHGAGTSGFTIAELAVFNSTLAEATIIAHARATGLR